jgi:peptidoglycan/xylan/chitin deacetylase (PgdA/CDA1 family)
MVLACFRGDEVSAQILKRPVPDHLVVLSFDDAASSHYHIVAPVLKKYHFGATFFVCEFPPDFPDTTKYMTWDQISRLNQMGFEIGNHTRDHIRLSRMDAPKLDSELAYIEHTCSEYGIPKPVSFAYPVWNGAPYAMAVLKRRGYLFARAGGNRPYDPRKDNPYLIPSYNEATTDSARMIGISQEAKDGKIVVLTIHGVPDKAHSWVNTPPARFEGYMKYLHDNHYTVISVRDLGKYVNAPKALREIPPVFQAKK